MHLTFDATRPGVTIKLEFTKVAALAGHGAHQLKLSYDLTPSSELLQFATVLLLHGEIHLVDAGGGSPTWLGHLHPRVLQGPAEAVELGDDELVPGPRFAASSARPVARGTTPPLNSACKPTNGWMVIHLTLTQIVRRSGVLERCRLRGGPGQAPRAQ